jgi:hypothetical protein
MKGDSEKPASGGCWRAFLMGLLTRNQSVDMYRPMSRTKRLLVVASVAFALTIKVHVAVAFTIFHFHLLPIHKTTLPVIKGRSNLVWELSWRFYFSRTACRTSLSELGLRSAGSPVLGCRHQKQD